MLLDSTHENDAVLEISNSGLTYQVTRTGRETFWSLVQSGRWEPETFEVFDRFLDHQHSYIDIGSWIGPTLLFGGQIARRAFGVEPDPIAYAELERNLTLNEGMAGKIQLFSCAIVPKSGPVVIGSRGSGGDSMSSLLFSSHTTTWTVRGVTLQEFVETNGIHDCNFVKIDIEGGEYSVIPASAEFLKKWRPTLYLSLHPCFLGPGTKGWIGKVQRTYVRLTNTIRIYRALRGYRNLYASNWIKLSAWGLLRHSLKGKAFAIVATNLDCK